jgi:glutamate dehydrogenase/leucine dehydrogenase
VLHGGGLEEQGWSRQTLDERLAGLGDAIYEILQTAEREGINSDAAARRIAMSRIAAAG